MKYILLGMAFAIPSVSIAQPDTLWTKDTDNTGLNSEVIMTSDGGYAIGSYSWPGPPRRDTDQAVIKLDSTGNEVWRQFYTVLHPDSFQQSEEGHTIKQLSDNGFFLAGSGPGNGGAMIVRTDSTGEVIWMRSWEWREFTNFKASAHADGDHVVVIDEYGGIEFDEAGEIVWQEIYALSGGDLLTGISATDDGGYIICGRTYGIGNRSGEAYAVKIDHEGEVEWRNGYGTEEYYDFASGITQTVDGGYCLVGGSEQDRENYGMVVKIDSEGNEEWSHIYNDDNPTLNYRYCVVSLPDSGIAMGGYGRGAPMGRGYFYLDRLDSDGNYLWGGAYLVEAGFRDFTSLYLMPDYSYLMGGAGGDGFRIIRTEPDPDLIMDTVRPVDPSYPSVFHFLSSYPNPFNSTTTITYSVGANSNSPVTLSLYDLSGRLVQTLVNERLTPGKYWTTLNANNLTSGMYVIRLESNTPLIKGGQAGFDRQTGSSQKVVIVK